MSYSRFILAAEQFVDALYVAIGTKHQERSAVLHYIAERAIIIDWSKSNVDKIIIIIMKMITCDGDTLCYMLYIAVYSYRCSIFNGRTVRVQCPYRSVSVCVRELSTNV